MGFEEIEFFRAPSFFNNNEYQLSTSIIRNWLLDDDGSEYPNDSPSWICCVLDLDAWSVRSLGGAIKWSIIDALHKLFHFWESIPNAAAVDVQLDLIGSLYGANVYYF